MIDITKNFKGYKMEEKVVIKNLTKKDFNSMFTLCNEINSNFKLFSQNLIELKNKYRRLESYGDNNVLDAYVALDFDFSDIKFINKNIYLVEPIYFIQVENDSYNIRKFKIMKIFDSIFKEFDKISGAIETAYNEDSNTVIVTKENYKDFIDLYTDLSKLDFSIILKNIEDILISNPLSIIDETKIVFKDKETRTKIIVFGFGKERFRISINITSLYNRSFCLIEKYTFANNEWKEYHSIDVKEYILIDQTVKIPKGEMKENTFDRLINACINYIYNFEGYNIKEDKN